MHFASDNSGPVHPAVMDALTAANTGHVPSYGADPITARVTDRIRTLFDAPKAEVHLVATGTAGNALALASLARPWDRIWCAPLGHVALDECGAVELATGGASLTPVPGPNGKMCPDQLAKALAAPVSDHTLQKGPVTLSQATELGTLYTVDELCALTEIARAYGCATHMDGARLANALAASGASPADMTWRAGVDALTLGGTKNGLMNAEAVVFFTPSDSFALRRKRSGHLVSKQRYLAAQLDAYLDGVWLTLAAQSNTTAQRVARALAQTPGVRLIQRPQVNMIFADLPQSLHDRLTAAGAVYHQADVGVPPRPGRVHARFVADWSLSRDDVDRFVAALSAP